MKEKYIIEVFDHHGDNCATITEIALYNEQTEINYTVLDAYDLVTNSVPFYWNNTSYWGKDRLSNKNKTYTSNSTGGQSSTLFLYNGTAGKGNWARFVIEADSQIDRMILTAGSPEKRIPKIITIYHIEDTYSSNMVQTRATKGLVAINALEFPSTLTTPTDFEVDMKIELKRLALKNTKTGQHYSLTDRTLIDMPNASDKNMILVGVQKGKEIRLDVPFDKHDYINDSPAAATKGKIFTQDISKVNTLSLREGEPKRKELINEWYETKMTSDTLPSPLVASTSSRNSDAKYYPYRAFNGTMSEANDVFLFTPNVLSGWLQLDFGKITKVNQVRITSINYSVTAATGSPKKMKLLASIDGVNFKEVFIFPEQTGWTPNEVRTFNLNKVLRYRYYRLDIESNNGYTAYTAVGQLQFGLNEEY